MPIRNILKMIFNKHEGCRGLTLFRFFRWNVEIWICPKRYVIKPHSHPNEHIELMYLCGKTMFCRIKDGVAESYKPKWYHVFRTFSVKPGIIHWFEVSNQPLIFINFAKFLKGHKPQSASKDFKQYYV